MLFIAALMNIGIKSNAQCSTSFTYTVNSANNGEVSFSATATPIDTMTNYSWLDSNGTYIGYGQNITYSFPNSGTYTICLTTTIGDSLNSSICTASFCDSVAVVNNNCSAYFQMYTDSVNGSTYFYPYVTGSPTDYFWDFGDGTSSTLEYPPSHFFTATGIHIICFTASNANTSCTATYCDSLFISSCVATFTAVNDNVGNGVTFTSTATTSVDTYSWDFGDGGIATTANPYHSYNANGYYNVCLTVSSSTDSSCSYTTCQYINVNGMCDANFAIISDSTNQYNFWVYNYSNYTSSTAYFWDFGDGTSSTEQYPVHTYAGSGPYYLCLTVADSMVSCTDTQCDSIVPGHAPSSAITLTVVNPATLGIHEASNAATTFENYPNPFNGSTTINYSVSKNAKVELSVFDLVGNKIAVIENENKSAGKYSKTWNAENISQGMYLLQLKVDNQISTKKIIITQ